MPPIRTFLGVLSSGPSSISRISNWIPSLVSQSAQSDACILECRRRTATPSSGHCLRRAYSATVIDWVVYAKRPFGGPEYVLQYLGRYTHRVAISNHRLVSFVEGKVTFRWRDSAHNNEQKLMTLELDEFLRRFLLHLLPKGFVRIRNFGFLANRRRATLLPLCFQLLGATQEPRAQQDLSSTRDSHDLWRCPQCGGPMVVIERFTAAEIQLRSPPLLTSAA